GVRVLLGNGDGTFLPPSTWATDRPEGVRIGDMNGDGKPDLVTADYSLPATISIFLGNGDGTFGSAIAFPLGFHANRLALGDLDRDGKLDVAVTDTGSGAHTVTILFGNGDGSLGSPIVFSVGDWPQSVQIGDLNGDGWPDFTVDSHNSLMISVFLNRGDGTFKPRQDYPLGDLTGGHTLGDVNRDGHLDLIVAIGGNQVSVLLGNGDGSF